MTMKNAGFWSSELSMACSNIFFFFFLEDRANEIVPWSNRMRLCLYTGLRLHCCVYTRVEQYINLYTNLHVVSLCIMYARNNLLKQLIYWIYLYNDIILQYNNIEILIYLKLLNDWSPHACSNLFINEISNN